MRTPTKWVMAFIACGIAWTGMAGMGTAAFPDRAVKIIVGFAPGGNNDTIARLLAPKLSEKWGVPVVVENRTGADATIAGEVVAHAPPDGYLLDLVANAHTITPSLYKLAYDPVKSFAPVTELGYTPEILLINPNYLKVQSLSEFIALAKSKPGELTFGSSGAGTIPFLDMALLMKLTRTKLIHVPFKGSGAALVGLLSGEINAMWAGAGDGITQVKAGKLKALAISSKTRSPMAPDLPTVAEEAHLPTFDVSNWYGILTTGGTPKDVVNKLNKDIVDVLKSPDIQDHLKDSAFTLVGNSPEEYAKVIADEIPKWGDILKDMKPN